MMYNYPFFSFPNFKCLTSNYSPYYNKEILNLKKNMQNSVQRPTYNYSQKYNNSNASNFNNTNKKAEKKFDNECNQNIKKENHTGFSFLDNFLHQEDRDSSESYFEIFGLKLYNDDILLLGLIFFLYKEDVKDQYLFFALILLLLS